MSEPATHKAQRDAILDAITRPGRIISVTVARGETLEWAKPSGMDFVELVVASGHGGAAADGTPGKPGTLSTKTMRASELPDTVTLFAGRGGRGWHGEDGEDGIVLAVAYRITDESSGETK